jgi:DNA-binding response OmpR family regulator
MDPTQPSPKKIILLLHDIDPVLLRVMRVKVEKDVGWHSLIATTYVEVLDLLEKEQPHGIMMDIIVNDDRGRTGFDLLHDIRKERNSSIPIVIFTDLAQLTDRQKAMDFGASAYFVKSEIGLNELIGQLQFILSSSVSTV